MSSVDERELKSILPARNTLTFRHSDFWCITMAECSECAYDIRKGVEKGEIKVTTKLIQLYNRVFPNWKFELIKIICLAAIKNDQKSKETKNLCCI